MERIIIKHRSGSKANQMEIFPLIDYQELTFGRDPALNVKYDPNLDDRVSRKHATIQWDSNRGRFIIIDFNSRNGLFVNNKKVDQKIELHHGDIVQLGSDGPEFLFELDPAPTNVLPPTRQIQSETLSSSKVEYAQDQHLPHTSAVAGTDMTALKYGDANVSQQVAGESIYGDTGIHQKPVGRDTVERLISQNKSESRRYLINLAALLLGILAIIGGYFIYKNTILQKSIQQTNVKLQPAKISMSPQEIAKTYGPATVRIELTWLLIDRESGRQIYHRYWDGKPAYIQIGDGPIEPLLATSEGKGANTPIVGHTIESGVVIDDRGFILASRRIVEPWNYDKIRLLAGKVFMFDIKKGKLVGTKDTREIDWEPSNITFLDEECKKCERPKYKKEDNFTRNEVKELKVLFYRSKLSIPAQVARISDEHDVALIRVDTPTKVAYAKVSEESARIQVNPGDPITILCYPSLLFDPAILTASKDIFSKEEEKEVVIPDPTVITGVIGKVIRGEQKLIKQDAKYKSEWDTYQLTVNQIGSNIRGAPVFNNQGYVIGIFYARRGDNIAYAVPIKYGLDLIEVKPAVK